MNLCQDSYGHIWVGTEYGLNRYDGSSFRRFTQTDYPALFTNRILHLSAAPNGNIVVGSHNGLALLYDQANDDLLDVAPDDYAQTYNKTCYGFHNGKELDLLTSNGFYVFDDAQRKFDNKFPIYEKTNNEPVSGFLVDRFGRYWLSNMNRVVVYDKQGKMVFQSLLDNKNDLSYEQQLIQISDSLVLFVGHVNHLTFFSVDRTGRIFPCYSVKTPFSNMRKTVKCRNGGFWFITDGDGLWHCDALPHSASDFTRVYPFDSKNEEFNKLYTAVEDRDGGLWVGGLNSGLWYFRANSASRVVSSAQIGFTKPCCGFSFMTGDVQFFSSDGNGVYSYDKKNAKLRLYGDEDGLTSKNVTGMLSDKSGNLIVSTWGSGLFVKNVGSDVFSHVPFKFQNVEPKNILGLLRGFDDDIWIAAGGDGVFVLKDSVWSHHLLKHPGFGPDPDLWPQFFVKGSENTVWIVSSSTIWIDKNGNPEPIKCHYQGQNKSDMCSLSDGVYSEKYGYLFTSNRGVLRFDKEGLSYEMLDFLPSGEYSSICVDNSGKFWTSGSNGVICFDVEQKTYFSTPMDFSQKGANFFVNRAKCALPNGSVFFGHYEGYTCFNSSSDKSVDSYKHLDFSELFVDGVKVKPFSDILPDGRISNNCNIYLPYDQTNLRIIADDVDFDICKSRCSYKLDGLDESWTDIGSRRSIDFSYIPPGSYTLRLRYFMAGGSDAAQDQVLYIHVSPPWWKTTWFYALILFVILAYVYMKWRSMKHAQVVLQQKVDERTKELQVKNKQIEQNNLDLNLALNHKDKIIAVIAHDLKNPMFAIVGALDGLVSNQNTIDKAGTQQIVCDVLSSARKLQDKMIELLSWATSKQYDIKYHPGITNLQQVIEDDLALLKMEMATKGVGLTKKFELKNYAFIDGRMFSTAARNLIGNAIKFTPAGNSIHVNAWQEEKFIKLEIRDEGVGMSKEKLAEISNANRSRITTEGAHGEKGTGLGTGMAQEFVQMNKGMIDVRSVEGEGTVFTITVPVSDQVLPAAPVLTEEEKKRRPVEINKELIEGNTILVVDDDKLIRETVKGMLGAFVNVLTAENGQQALDVLEHEVVDIVLSDVEMPVLDGIAMSRQLMQDSRFCHLPVVFLSARSSEDDRLKGLLSGAIDYIPKPFSRDELMIKVTNILTIRRNTQNKLLMRQLDEPLDGLDVDDVGLADVDDAVSDNDVDQVAPVGQTSDAVSDSDDIINPQLQRVLDIIKEKYSDSEYTVERLADDMCMTKITLYRRVKTLSGKTPIEVLTEFRLNKALQMLKCTSVPIGDVAFQVGFSDPAYFTRRFKSHFGYPPSSVRES